MKKLLSVILISIMAFIEMKAQDYKYEIGVAAGIGTYMGDANQSSVLHKPGAAFSGIFRYVPNYRWAIKVNLATASLRGDTRDFSNVFPEEKHYDFKRQLFDLGAQAEFNFFNYGMGYSYQETSRISPYLLAGLGVSFSPASGDNFFSVNIPLGVGVKYKIAPRWNIALEFTVRKTLGDNLDGKDLKDPYRIESSAFKNTDWYSMTLFSITYEFGYRRKPCNN